MNSIDVLVLVIIAFNLLLGAFRGAMWQVLRIGAIVLGVYCAARYGSDFLEMWPPSLSLEPGTGVIVAQIVLFLSVYIIMFGVTHVMKAIIDKVKLGAIDRLLGAGLGAAKGVFFCLVILYLQFLPIPQPDAVRDQLYGNVEKKVPASTANILFVRYVKDRIEKVVPEDMTNRVKEMSVESEVSAGLVFHRKYSIEHVGENRYVIKPN